MKNLTTIEDFLWYLSAEKRLSPLTEESYRNDLRLWSEVLEMDFSEKTPPSPQQLRKALEHFKKNKLKSSTMARRKATLRVFARYRSLTDIAWAELLQSLPSQKADDKFPKALTLEEVKKFLSFVPQTSRSLDWRNKALFELMYASGMRASEILFLEWSHIDERLGGIRFVGKGLKSRFVPFTEDCGHWLFKYKEVCWPSLVAKSPKRFKDLVFPGPTGMPLSRMGLWKIIRKKGLSVGIENMHPHVLRHTFATHLLKGGADVRFVQVMLGHSSLDTTEKYLRITDDELRTLFLENHPLAIQKKVPLENRGK
jgi:integrase/recombinase XerD